MPNHVTNILKASSFVIAALKGSEELVDFNTMIPMPESVKNIECNGDDRLVAFLNGEISMDAVERTPIMTLQLSNILQELKDGGMSKWRDDRFENFITMLRNQRQHGVTSWYDFGCERWGTKWNAYSIYKTYDGVQFDTAWSAPHPVITALAAKFPDERIEHLWADEDIGSNLGHRVYYRGGVEEILVEDPVDFALTITGCGREYYQLNSSTGKWESKPCEV